MKVFDEVASARQDLARDQRAYDRAVQRAQKIKARMEAINWKMQKELNAALNEEEDARRKMIFSEDWLERRLASAGQPKGTIT